MLRVIRREVVQLVRRLRKDLKVQRNHLISREDNNYWILFMVDSNKVMKVIKEIIHMKMILLQS